MKKLILVILSIVLFASCDPDVPGEGINLPQMEFGMKVSPDTAYIKLGDTVTIYTSISSTLSNGVEIEDGQAIIKLFFGYCMETPVESLKFETATNDLHFEIADIRSGGVNISASYKGISDIFAVPYGDSIKLEISIIPLKVGTYVFQTQSSFYEGSAGKTRTQPKFDMPNHHFDELRKDGPSDLSPGEIGYDSRYNFAVYE